MESIIVAIMRKFVLLLPLIFVLPQIFKSDQTMAVYFGGTNRRLSGGIFHDRAVCNSIQESAAENVCLEIFGDLCRNLRSFPFVFLLQHDV